MPIPSLKDLCIFNSLGSSYLLESCLISFNKDNSELLKFSDPNSRCLPKDLAEKIISIVEQFNICMQSQEGFFKTIEKEPELALFLIRTRYAASSKNQRLFDYLKEKNHLDVNAVDIRGKTVLHYAVESWNKELFEYLINEQNIMVPKI